MNERDFISKLMLVNIYCAAFNEVERVVAAYVNCKKMKELDAGWNAKDAASRLGMEVEYLEKVSEMFVILAILDDSSLEEQIAEFDELYNEFVRSSTKKLDADPAIYKRMFLAMHALVDVGDYGDITPADYQTLQNAYKDSHAVHHNHFSGINCSTFLLVSEK